MLQALIIMSKPPGNPDPEIPSVFVSQKAGLIMQKLLELDDIRVSISSVSCAPPATALLSLWHWRGAGHCVSSTLHLTRAHIV